MKWDRRHSVAGGSDARYHRAKQVADSRTEKNQYNSDNDGDQYKNHRVLGQTLSLLTWQKKHVPTPFQAAMM
jgi:hypothetical protein